MRSEPPRQEPGRMSQIREELFNADLIAVACFAALAFLITILLACIFPLERPIGLLMQFD
jgi:hypothetical protein